MEENTEYKPFVRLEQYDPEATGYYNTQKTLAATKNDCSSGYTGSSVTLTANANEFFSSNSITDANEQADAWLSANAQAYANNLGICVIRPTAWRGINPSCLLEDTTSLTAFNFMVVKYKWASGAGADLDTFTGVINSGTILDNNWLGYGQGSNSVPNDTAIGSAYSFWAGDNTNQVAGFESVLVNFSKITTDFPSLASVVVKLAATWYGLGASGNIDIEIKTYSGGTMSQSGYDIINTGGTPVQTLNFSKNIPTQNQSASITNATDVGYITYTKSSTTGQISITY